MRGQLALLVWALCYSAVGLEVQCQPWGSEERHALSCEGTATTSGTYASETLVLEPSDYLPTVGNAFGLWVRIHEEPKDPEMGLAVQVSVSLGDSHVTPIHRGRVSYLICVSPRSGDEAGGRLSQRKHREPMAARRRPSPLVVQLLVPTPGRLGLELLMHRLNVHAAGETAQDTTETARWLQKQTVLKFFNVSEALVQGKVVEFSVRLTNPEPGLNAHITVFPYDMSSCESHTGGCHKAEDLADCLTLHSVLRTATRPMGYTFTVSHKGMLPVSSWSAKPLQAGLWLVMVRRQENASAWQDFEAVLQPSALATVPLSQVAVGVFLLPICTVMLVVATNELLHEVWMARAWGRPLEVAPAIWHFAKEVCLVDGEFRRFACTRLRRAFVGSSYSAAVTVAATAFFTAGLQLAFEHWEESQTTGDRDICHYNFECYVPWKADMPVNSLMSHLPYLSCGLLVMMLALQADFHAMLPDARQGGASMSGQADREESRQPQSASQPLAATARLLPPRARSTAESLGLEGLGPGGLPPVTSASAPASLVALGDSAAAGGAAARSAKPGAVAAAAAVAAAEADEAPLPAEPISCSFGSDPRGDSAVAAAAAARVATRSSMWSFRVDRLAMTGLPPPDLRPIYGLGAAEVMEGCGSFIYHICPQKADFQFDVALMFVIAFLSGLALLDVDEVTVETVPPTAFMLLLVVPMWFMTFMGTWVELGVLTSHRMVYSYTILSLLWGIVVLSYARVLFAGNRLGLWLFRIIVGSIFAASVLCRRVALWLGGINKVLLMLSLVTAGTMALRLLARHGWLTGEHRSWKSCCYSIFTAPAPLCLVGIFSTVTWVALEFFRHTPYKSGGFAWQSREKNQGCVLGIFDSHDVWHILSAVALALWALVLLEVKARAYRSKLPSAVRQQRTLGGGGCALPMVRLTHSAPRSSLSRWH